MNDITDLLNSSDLDDVNIAMSLLDNNNSDVVVKVKDLNTKWRIGTANYFRLGDPRFDWIIQFEVGDQKYNAVRNKKSI